MKKSIDWGKMQKERRGKILWMREDQMLDFIIINQKSTQVARISLPDNCHVLTIYRSNERQAFGFVILSDKFEPVPVGGEMPSIELENIGGVVVQVDVGKENNE